MGYYQDQTEWDFRILRKNYNNVARVSLEMLNYPERMTGGGLTVGPGLEERWYSWTDTPSIRRTAEAVLAATNGTDEEADKAMRALFGEWGFEVHFDDEGLCDMYSLFDKSGDEDQLFANIAPFVEDGCYVMYRGEDGAEWAFAFRDGRVWLDTFTRIQVPGNCLEPFVVLDDERSVSPGGQTE